MAVRAQQWSYGSFHPVVARLLFQTGEALTPALAEIAVPLPVTHTNFALFANLLADAVAGGSLTNTDSSASALLRHASEFDRISFTLS
jgi:hypothetical protein